MAFVQVHPANPAPVVQQHAQPAMFAYGYHPEPMMHKAKQAMPEAVAPVPAPAAMAKPQTRLPSELM